MKASCGQSTERRQRGMANGNGNGWENSGESQGESKTK